MDIILDIIENFDLRQNTKKNYISQFKTIHKALSINNSIDYIDDIDLLLHYLDTISNISSRRTKAAVVSKILQTDKRRYRDQIEQLKNYMLNLNNEEIVKPFKPELTLKEIRNKINLIEDDDKAKLLLSLVTNHPVLRGDYNTIKLIDYNEDTDNYFDGKRLVFNKLLKTDNGVRPIKLNTVERALVNIIKQQGDEYLFGFASTHGFNLYLRKSSKKYIGFNYGIQHYRRLYTSSTLDGKLKMDKKAEELARDMNHSSVTQKKYYLHQI